jgi:SAM-dependent methyltransferase
MKMKEKKNTGVKPKVITKLTRGTQILDIGFAQDPNPFLKDPIGIDIQKVQKPENYKEIHAVNLNKEKIPFKNEIFDTVIAADIIEHLENPSLLLRECNRVLKKDGKFIISTPHANYWWTIIHNWFLRWIKDDDVGQHLSNWTKLDMVRLLRRNGFYVEKLWGTEIAIPILNIKIPVKKFPMLGWIIIYETTKRREPIEEIYTYDKKGKAIKMSEKNNKEIEH